MGEVVGQPLLSLPGPVRPPSLFPSPAFSLSPAGSHPTGGSACAGISAGNTTGVFASTLRTPTWGLEAAPVSAGSTDCPLCLGGGAGQRPWRSSRPPGRCCLVGPVLQPIPSGWLRTRLHGHVGGCGAATWMLRQPGLWPGRGREVSYSNWEYVHFKWIKVHVF